MLHLIIGAIAIIVGLRGLLANSYLFKDVLAAVLPLTLLCFGVVALLAGMRKIKKG